MESNTQNYSFSESILQTTLTQNSSLRECTTTNSSVASEDSVVNINIVVNNTYYVSHYPAPYIMPQFNSFNPFPMMFNDAMSIEVNSFLLDPLRIMLLSTNEIHQKYLKTLILSLNTYQKSILITKIGLNIDKIMKDPITHKYFKYLINNLDNNNLSILQDFIFRDQPKLIQICKNDFGSKNLLKLFHKYKDFFISTIDLYLYSIYTHLYSSLSGVKFMTNILYLSYISIYTYVCNNFHHLITLKNNKLILLLLKHLSFNKINSSKLVSLINSNAHKLILDFSGSKLVKYIIKYYDFKYLSGVKTFIIENIKVSLSNSNSTKIIMHLLKDKITSDELLSKLISNEETFRIILISNSFFNFMKVLPLFTYSTNRKIKGMINTILNKHIKSIEKVRINCISKQIYQSK